MYECHAGLIQEKFTSTKNERKPYMSSMQGSPITQSLFIQTIYCVLCKILLLNIK